MRAMKRVVIFSFLSLAALVAVAAFTNDETSDEKRLEAFLTKVEKFYKNKDQMTTNWSMPNANPESSEYTMPSRNNNNNVDHETGLQYNASSGKIVDPQLNMELDTVTGIIYDLKTNKEYSLADIQAERDKQH